MSKINKIIFAALVCVFPLGARAQFANGGASGTGPAIGGALGSGAVNGGLLIDSGPGTLSESTGLSYFSNVFKIANGTHSQGLNLYNFYTDAKNYSRATFDFTTNPGSLTIGTQAEGTGVGADLVMTANGVNVMTTNKATGNYFFGGYAGNLTVVGLRNTGVGEYTLPNVTNGPYNTAVGEGALYSLSSGVSDTAVGHLSLVTNNGSYITAIGDSSGENLTTGNYVTVLGAQIGMTAGANNAIAIGDGDGTTKIDYGVATVGSVTVSAPTRLSTGYTVAKLPAAPGTGARAYVTDASTCTFLGTLAGGSTSFCPVVYNGTAWVGE